MATTKGNMLLFFRILFMFRQPIYVDAHADFSHLWHWRWWRALCVVFNPMELWMPMQTSPSRRGIILGMVSNWAVAPLISPWLFGKSTGSRHGFHWKPVGAGPKSWRSMGWMSSATRGTARSTGPRWDRPGQKRRTFPIGMVGLFQHRPWGAASIGDCPFALGIRTGLLGQVRSALLHCWWSPKTWRMCPLRALSDAYTMAP